jgi:MFS family permease
MTRERRWQLAAYLLLNGGFFFFDTAMGLFDVATYGYFAREHVASYLFALDFVMVSVPMLLGGWLAHLLNRRFGVRAVIGLGYTIATAGFLVLFLTGLYRIPLCLLIVAFLLGIVFSAILPALSRFIRDVFGAGKGAVLALKLDAIFMAVGMVAGVGFGTVWFDREGLAVFFPLATGCFALAGMIHVSTLFFPGVLRDYAGPEVPARWAATLRAMRRAETKWRSLMLQPSLNMVIVPLMVGLPAAAAERHYGALPVIGLVAAPIIVLAGRRTGMLAGRLLAPEFVLRLMVARRGAALVPMIGFFILYALAFVVPSLPLVFTLVFCAHLLSNVVAGAVFYGVQTEFPAGETAAASALQSQLSTGVWVIVASLATVLLVFLPPPATIGLAGCGLVVAALVLRGSGIGGLQPGVARPIAK